MIVTVRTQAELDQALAESAETIYINSDAGVWLTIVNSGSSSVVAWGSSSVVARGSSSVEARESSSVVARGSSSVEARESSSVVAWESSSVVARGSSSVEARESSSVVARGSSSVEARESSSVVAWESSSVVAWGSSSVEAWESSSVVAWGSSSVVARESSSVVAWGSSSVVARGSSSVEAWESSSVVAWESSSVVAWGSSSVEAWESSSVEAWESSRVEASRHVAVHLWSQRVQLSGDGHIIDLTAVDLTDPVQWCEFSGAQLISDIVYVYKAVGDDWKSEYGTEYLPGSTPEAPDWNTEATCGHGLHFCAHPLLSLEYMRGATKFVKVGVRLDEMVCLGDKIKARRVVDPCVEVDCFGDVIESSGITQ